MNKFHRGVKELSDKYDKSIGENGKQQQHQQQDQQQRRRVNEAGK